MTADRRRSLVVASVVVAALVLGVVLYLRKRSAQPAAAEAEVVVGVRVAKAEHKPIAAESSTLGTIFPREASRRASRATSPRTRSTSTSAWSA